MTIISNLLNEAQGVEHPPYSRFHPRFSHQPFKKPRATLPSLGHVPGRFLPKSPGFCLPLSKKKKSPIFSPPCKVSRRDAQRRPSRRAFPKGEKHGLGEGADGLRANPASNHEKLARAGKKYPGQRHVETPSPWDGAAEAATRCESPLKAPPGAPNQHSQQQRAFNPKASRQTS